MSDIVSAKHAYERAREEFIAAVKASIKDALDEAFEDSEVQSVVFGVSTDPYNDENPGQGVYGPDVNNLSYEDDFSRDDRYTLYYDRSGGDSQACRLAEVLKEAGWEAAGEALGVAYYPEEGSGRTTTFVAQRKAQPELDGVQYTLTEYDGDY